MQVTIDIPEPLYHALESRARDGRVSLEQLVLAGASRLVIENKAHEPGVLLKMGVNLNDLALMTDDELERFERALGIDPEAALRDFDVRRLQDGF
jgi:hypothetical protein